MEFKNMSVSELEARKAEIATLVDNEDSDLDALTEEVRAINEELEARKNAEAKKEEIRSLVADGEGETVEEITTIEERKTMDVMEIRNSAEYINAYAEYIKTGNDKECRALLSENSAAGGSVAVPELVYEIVKNAWEKEGIMRLVKKTYLRGNLKVSFEVSADPAVVHTTEGTLVNEENLVLGTVELTPKSIKKWISVSDEALDLRGREFLQYIYEELTYRIAKKAADELLAKIEACGTQTTTGGVGVANISASSIQMGTVADAIAHLSDQAANPVIIMNKLTYSAFKAVQYANGYGADPFEGLPVLFNNSIAAFSAATTGVTYAIVGDLGEGALANFPNGQDITIKYDDLSLAEKDLVKIVGRQFVGLGVIAPNAFARIKK
jgi:HK97 family phage major capsid protein